MQQLTVLYDAQCPLCSRFRDWLEAQALLLPVHLVPACSAQVHDLFPTLDHARTLEEITVVGDDGAVWTQEHAWVMCLWATRAHRGLAEQLARPQWLPLARGAATSAAGLRHLLHGAARTGARTVACPRGGDYPDHRVAPASPLPQG
ncbi:hypothetical protein NPS01_26810 [Nocardioides psychrotolerans]|uniref:DUF393 domain-containing protein n=1 Tax=Nocardioides psychrotolerans TaxID=1005945 RepID=A0A1I3MUF2_9ACTN|nr:DCC1-like thiol-disulfide oxidoreductase family protein [Nocardioides psychrotolerans]GEP39018.1 hypothetical protein NPS01_26810 [Nocardioides psychrotolerans]SFJ00355.1 Protein of unknown function, DUF393 [Nocardioides psychrotolerans]